MRETTFHWNVVLRHIATDGGVTNEVVWQQPACAELENPKPRLAVSPGGEIVVAHRTPDGKLAREIFSKYRDDAGQLSMAHMDPY